MTVREIQGHLEELYGLAVSPDLISRVTDAVIEEVREWQNRPAAGLRLSPSIRTAWRSCPYKSTPFIPPPSARRAKS